MASKGLLGISRAVGKHQIAIQTEHRFVAVRSESLNAVPFIPWTVLEVISTDPDLHSKDEILVTPEEFGLPYVKPDTRIIWLPVTPPEISHVVLIASHTNFVELSASKEKIKRSLPRFIRSGSELQDLECYVAACEPVDQGIIPDNLDSFTVSVVEAERETTRNPIEPASSDHISIEPFLELGNTTVTSIELDLTPLSRPIPANDILPPVPADSDLENIGFVNLSRLAELGIFSGDMVKLKPAGHSPRFIFLHSYPDSSKIQSNTLYVSPILKYNLGNPDTVIIEKIIGQRPHLEAAKDVMLSRVSSPASTDKANQSAFLHGLKSYFTHSMSRVVINNDLITVPINSTIATLFFNGSNSNQSEEEDVDLQSLVLSNTTDVDTVIWFQVNGLPSDCQYVISPAHTRMVQSGIIQRLAPPTNLEWKPYLGLRPDFDYFGTSKKQDFKYAHTLLNLLRSSLTPRGAALKTTLLLKSSKRGVGKSTVLQSVAAHLGIHMMVMDAHYLIGDSDGKTLALLKARLERAAATDQCLVSILHFESLVKKNDVDGKDTPLVNGIVDILDDFGKSQRAPGTRGGNVIISATVNDPDVVADSVRMKFKFEVDVTVPSESERHAIFRYLTSDKSDFNNMSHLVSNIDKDACTGFSLRGDISLDSLAQESAGLTPLDLKSIIYSAKQSASLRATQDSILCCNGKIKITPQDMSTAIADARDKFSDSIGAPKIPNVGWKDVGGLDMVKGEILDTIEMPLKHPEMFANGLKKRSGILFYGPPGTGKTLLAKAIATNFSLNFFSVKGPELLNMYIGESEANVRRIFQKARDAKPCVVFFDELDSVAPKRGNKGDSGGVMDRIVSQLLAELDGMNSGGDGVFCVGATNRPDLLDEALLRPGRFDKMLYLGVSDTHEKQRTILEALTRKFDLDSDVDLAEVAEKCPFSYTGADFYALSSDAMLNAMTRTAGDIDAKILEYNAQHPDEPISIRKWFQSISNDQETKVRVSRADFDKAMRELVPSVSADELQHYLNVRNTFEGKAQ